MVTKPPGGTVANDAGVQARLDEALARLKAATDKHEAVVSALSRLGASAQEKRFAQSEKKKIEHELREARRQVEQARGS